MTTGQKITQKTRVLFRARAVFPFDFWPDEVVVEKSKITINRYVFLGFQEILTVAIDDIFSVEVDTSPILAAINISTRLPMTPIITISHLLNSDALKLQAIIQGLLIAKNERINIADLTPGETLAQARRLGRARSELLRST